MRIGFINQATNESALLNVENFDLIGWMKKLHLPSNKIHEAYNEVIDSLKDVNGAEVSENPEVNENPDVMDNHLDMMVMMADGLPFAHVIKNGELKDIIFVMEIPGNCVDKFMAYHMNKFTAKVRTLSQKIEQGQTVRMSEEKYHDSAQFEKDFSALTEIRKTCEGLAESIRKFQENITISNYTA